MASVTNLDQDMKRLRMARYTAGAITELRTWIEETLGERLAGGDVLEGLRDGIVLCRLANLALPSPGIKYKKSQMPFIQMENIAHFLRACENPPFGLPSHDRFLTVDLYELKDPAQVIQCLGAFSRVAHALFPAKFPHTIGPKRAAAMSPSHTGASSPAATYDHSRTVHKSQLHSPVKNTAGSVTGSAFTGASSILYSGYTGGASQGNQGISFGGRRQITTPAPFVPSLAEKERRRKDKEAEDERRIAETKEEEIKQKIQQETRDERERIKEEGRWEEETRRLREEEKQKVQDQKREWEEQEKRWKQAEQERIRGEHEAQSQAQKETQRRRGLSDPRLRGQYLSDYQKEERTKKRQDGAAPVGSPESERSGGERERIQELERQLEEAKAREQQYQEERYRRDEQRQTSETDVRSTSRSLQNVPKPSKTAGPRDASPQESNVSWTPDDREYLRNANAAHEIYPDRSHNKHHHLDHHDKNNMNSSRTTSSPPARPLPDPAAAQRRPLPEPSAVKSFSRPLPDPAAYASHPTSNINRTDRFLSHHQAPPPSQPPQTFVPSESLASSTFEQRAEDARREASQHQTKAGGRASKSLLEREMERERERQREWEHSQKELQNVARDPNAGVGAGQTWDVNQYGYMGGDSQNRGGNGIGFGAKRQILGPRPPP